MAETFEEEKKPSDTRTRRARLLEYVMAEVRSARRRLQGKYEMWDRMDKYWRSYRFTKPVPWRANVWNPLSFFLIETVLPQMVMSIFQNPRKIFDVLPTEQNDIDSAKTMETLLNFQLLSEMDASLPLIKIMKSNLILGTGVGRDGWDFLTQKPTLKHLKLRSYLWDPSAEDFQTARWKAADTMERLEDLQSLARNGLYHSLDQITPARPRGEYPDGLEQRDLQPQDQVRHVRHLEWHGPVPQSLLVNGGNPNLFVQALVVIANDTVVIRDEPTPFPHLEPPFIEAIDHVDIDDALGLGELEPIQSLQVVASDLMSQYLDSRNLELNAMWLAARGADVAVNSLISRPGGVILAGDVNQVQRLEPKNQTPSMIADQNFLLQLAQMGAGVSNLSAGVQGANTPDTATGTELLIGAAGKRIALKMFLFTMVTLKILGRHLVSMNQAFLPPEKLIRVVGEGTDVSFLAIRRDAVAGRNFDVTPVPSVIFGGANFQVRELTNLLGILLGRFAQVNPVQVNPKPILDRIMSLAGIQDTRILESQDMAQGLLQQGFADNAKQNGSTRPTSPLSPQNTGALV